MKRYSEILMLMLFLLLGFPIFGQEPESQSDFETGKFLDKENKLLIDVVRSNLLEEAMQSQATPSSNQVFITQVGFANTINSIITSSDAIVNLEQKGDNNTIDLDLTAARIRYDFRQHGNNNVYEHIVTEPIPEITISHIQEGNNNVLQSFGTNSIGSSLQIKMTGDSETVMVRNFN